MLCTSPCTYASQAVLTGSVAGASVRPGTVRAGTVRRIVTRIETRSRMAFIIDDEMEIHSILLDPLGFEFSGTYARTRGSVT